ncbi:MAG: Stk1 family PASTA domain-containing Ser/Thr kinase [Clostridia bacterium]|nr:Stk1 family PASTA domain-containing Ser/Thr kinase [Clostridia bacterium]
MNLVGQLLAGRYEIIEEIGSGGMAVVYKAKCRILNRYVAIKVLRTDLKDDAEFLRRFNIEAQSAASLTHPNIVSIYDVGTEGDLHYIVMEFVEGITLKEYIDKNVLLNWKEALDYAIQIAKGLEQAHKNSIVHRDIKPHNIIMTSEGVLKITDFGIARASMQSTVTAEDTAIGSVHYVSPEQARGGYVDERSDIYSLGIVLYEMLTGKVPFDNESPVSIAIMHLQTQPQPPRDLNISIPKAVEDIVLKAIRKEVAERYATITEFKEALVLASKGAPIPAPEPKPTSQDLGETTVFTPIKDIPLSKEEQLTPPEKINTYENAPDIELTDNDEEEFDMPKKKPTDKQNVLVIVAALAASLAIIIFILSLFWDYISLLFGGGGKTVKIPQFVNMTYEEVMDKYEDSEYFRFLIPEYDEDEKEEDGLVLAQSPSPDSKVKYNEDRKIEITLTVNRLEKEKPSKETLEDYVGMDYKKVKKELDHLDITVKVKYEFHDDYEEDFIISQSVKEGTLISDIDVLTLTISKGQEKTESEDKPSENDEPSENDKPNNNDEPQATNRKRFTVYGPTDKASAEVSIKVNGKEIKKLTLAKGASDVVTIQSSQPSVNVEVFHDGILVVKQTVNME